MKPRSDNCSSNTHGEMLDDLILKFLAVGSTLSFQRVAINEGFQQAVTVLGGGHGRETNGPRRPRERRWVSRSGGDDCRPVNDDHEDSYQSKKENRVVDLLETVSNQRMWRLEETKWKIEDVIYVNVAWTPAVGQLLATKGEPNSETRDVRFKDLSIQEELTLHIRHRTCSLHINHQITMLTWLRPRWHRKTSPFVLGMDPTRNRLVRNNIHHVKPKLYQESLLDLHTYLSQLRDQMLIAAAGNQGHRCVHHSQLFQVGFIHDCKSCEQHRLGAPTAQPVFQPRKKYSPFVDLVIIKFYFLRWAFARIYAIWSLMVPVIHDPVAIYDDLVLGIGSSVSTPCRYSGSTRDPMDSLGCEGL
jgi:hypothetical protein